MTTPGRIPYPIRIAVLVALLLVPVSVASAQGYVATTGARGMTTIDGGAGTVTVLDSMGGTVFLKDQTIDVALPFDFTYFGQVMTAGTMITISSNGFIAMTPTTDAGRFNDAFPDSTGPNGVLGPLWDALESNASTGGKVMHQTTMIGGQQAFIVEWKNLVAEFGLPTLKLGNSQVILFADGSIQFRYPASNAEVEAHTASIGIEDQTGSTGIDIAMSTTFSGPPPGNITFAPPTMPELTGMVEAVQTNVNPGETIDLTRAVTNAGTPATNIEVNYVISTDATIDASDPVIGTETIASLPAAGGTFRVTIPMSAPVGATFFGIIVDPNNTIAEIDETNNAVASANTINVGGARYVREVLPRGTYTSIVDRSGATPTVTGTGGVLHFEGTANPQDDASVTVTLPFSFNFFGQAQTDLRVSVDGCVTFDMAVTDTTLDDNDDIPSTTTPEGIIGPFWDDLDVESGTLGAVATTTMGTAPNRVFIIEWANMEEAFDTGDVSFQCHLFEGTNVIEFHYPDPMSQDLSNTFEYSIGIESPDGLEGYAGFNTDNLNNDAPDADFRFTPLVITDPDLTVSGVDLLQTHTLQAQPLEIPYLLENTAADRNSAFDVSVYASLDATVDNTDILLGTVTIPSLASGAAINTPLSITIPNATPSGTYTIGVIVDPADNVTEFDESNNVATAPIMLTIGNALFTRSTFPIGTYTSYVGTGTTIISEATQAGFDEELLTVNMPFSFTYDGQSFNTIEVSTNGWASFNSGGTSSQLSPDDIPSTSTPEGALAVIWDDLESNDSDSAIVSMTLGTAPNRVFVIEWFNMEEFLSTGSVNGQLHLYEGSNMIELRYPDPASQNFSGMNSSIGIENFAGDEGYAGPSRDNTITDPPTENYRFAPPTFAGVELAVGGVTTLTPLVPAGSNAGLRVQVQNLGQMLAQAFDVTLVFSTDNTLDAGDMTIGTRSFTALAAGVSQIVDVFGTVPSGAANGPAFLFLRVDPAGAVTETLLGNNDSMPIAFDVGNQFNLPDLSIAPFTVSSTTIQMSNLSTDTPPGEISIDFDVTNSGPVDASGFDYEFQLSTDQRFDQGDIFVDALNSRSVAAGATVTETLLVDFDDGLGILPGTYFLSVTADSNEEVVESDETNNLATPVMVTLVGSATVDILPSDISVSSTLVAPGGTVTIMRSISNVSSVQFADTLDVVARLSDDRTITSGDDEIGRSTDTLSIPAGGTDGPVALTVTVPAAQPEGVYYLGIELTSFPSDANTGNDQHGDQQDNYTFPVPLTVAAPGTMINEVRPLGVPTVTERYVRQGQTVTFMTPRIANLGTTTLSNIDVGVYIAPGPDFQDVDFSMDPATATKVGSFVIPTLGPGGVDASRSFTFTVPAVLPGYFAAGVIVDDTNSITEFDEANNGEFEYPEGFTVEVPQLGIDLAVPQVSLSVGQARPGDLVTVTRVVSNNGANPALSFDVGVFLSDDATIDTSDVRLDTINFADGLFGNEGPSSFAVVIPMGTVDGTYFVGVLADEGNTVMELDETNNSGSAQLMVSVGPPCDVNFDGDVNVSDVQQVINVALGIPGVTPTGAENVNGDADTNVVDVQLVINGALGGSCP